MRSRWAGVLTTALALSRRPPLALFVTSTHSPDLVLDAEPIAASHSHKPTPRMRPLVQTDPDVAKMLQLIRDVKMQLEGTFASFLQSTSKQPATLEECVNRAESCRIPLWHVPKMQRTFADLTNVIKTTSPRLGGAEIVLAIEFFRRLLFSKHGSQPNLRQNLSIMTSVAQAVRALADRLLCSGGALILTLSADDCVRLLDGLASLSPPRPELVRSQLSPNLVPTLCFQLRYKELSCLPTGSVAETLWALAKLQHSDPELLDELCNQLRRPNALAEVVPQRLCFVLWALATLRHCRTDLAESIAEHLHEEIEGVPSQRLYKCDHAAHSLVVWSLARLGIPHPAILTDMEPLIIHTFSHSSDHEPWKSRPSDQSFTNMLWGYAELNMVSSNLRECILQYLQRPGVVERLNRGLANALGGIARMRIYDPDLMARFVAELLRPEVLSQFNSDELREVALALATFGAVPPDLVTALVHGMRDAVDFTSLEPKDVGTLAESLAALDVRDDVLLASLLQAIPDQKELPLAVLERIQSLLLHISTLDDAHLPLTKPLATRHKESLEATFRLQLSAAPPFVSHTDAMHEIVAYVEDMAEEANAPVQCHCLLPGTTIRVTAFIPILNLVIDVQDDSCFLRGADDEQWYFTGYTVLRQRLIRGLGYELFPVPLYQWKALRSGEEKEWFLMEGGRSPDPTDPPTDPQRSHATL